MDEKACARVRENRRQHGFACRCRVIRGEKCIRRGRQFVARSREDVARDSIGYASVEHAWPAESYLRKTRRVRYVEAWLRITSNGSVAGKQYRADAPANVAS